MYFLRGCLTWMMTEMMSKMTTRPQVTPIIVRLVWSRVSRMLAFLFSNWGDNIERISGLLQILSWWWVSQPVCQGTFAVILIPRVNTVLDTIAYQGLVDAHVAMAKESVSFTWSWKIKGKSHAAVVYTKHKNIPLLTNNLCLMCFFHNKILISTFTPCLSWKIQNLLNTQIFLF